MKREHRMETTLRKLTAVYDKLINKFKNKRGSIFAFDNFPLQRRYGSRIGNHRRK